MPNGVSRYRAALTSFYVDDAGDGRRRIEIDDDGNRVIFDLSADQAKHLAYLLSPTKPAEVGT
jgi:hypothetical protein